MNVLQGLDLVHIKVLGILSADYSRSSPKQVFFFLSLLLMSAPMLEVSPTEGCILPRQGGHRSEAPHSLTWPNGGHYGVALYL